MTPTIVGIDFGTTNTCVSYIHNGRPIVVPNDIGEFTTPSCIFFDPHSEEVLYGQAALDMMTSNDPLVFGNVIHNIKRLLGPIDETTLKFFSSKGLMFTKNRSIMILHNKQWTTYTWRQLTRMFLNYIHSNIITFLGHNDLRIVLTVPCYFGETQKQELMSVFNELNMIIIRIVHEPTAASLAYACSREEYADGNILVVDIGGGTSDFSVVYIDKSESFSEVLAVYGDKFLGGENLTDSLFNFYLEDISKKYRVDGLSAKQKIKLRRALDTTKVELSYKHETNVLLESFIGEQDVKISIGRNKFNEICTEFWATVQGYIKLLCEAHVEITGIVLVGGTSRLHILQEICKQEVGDVKVYDSINHDHVVSMGAAYQGAILTQTTDTTNDHVVIDVLASSLGVETMGGIYSPILSRNTHIPVCRSQRFTNSEDFQETITINVFQGERRLVKDNNLLAVFTLDHLDTTKRKGEMLIDVKFSLDGDGILNITAKEVGSGVSKDICVTKKLVSVIDNSSDLELLNDYIK